MKIKTMGALLLGALWASACASDPGADARRPSASRGGRMLPIVFVHGFGGSAQQYQSQALRFEANGYPTDHIRVYEHDGAGFDIPSFVPGLEAMVERVRQELNAEQVYLVGHSRGTSVVTEYLGDPGRAGKVAKYIALDGTDCPGEKVPCLSLMQSDFPEHGHVEVATSPESFRAQYEFLLGRPPEVVDIVPQGSPVKISGRAVHFPSNAGAQGATLEIWEVDARTGTRIAAQPHATFEIGADGAWGPVVVDPDARYEMALSGTGEVTHHIYMQPFVRSTTMVRLVSGRPDSPIRAHTHTGPGHAALIVMRMREWTRRDVLKVEVERPDGEPEPIEVLTRSVGDGNVALHLHDGSASSGESTLRRLPWFRDRKLQTGIDVFMPAAQPPDGSIRVTNLPRGDADAPQVLSVPNWASSEHVVTVVFSDYPR